MTLSPIAAWILTFLIHSTALFTAAHLVLRAVRGPAARVLVLRGALLGAFVTASVASFSTQGETWTLPATESQGRIISMAPGTTAATIEQEPPALANLGERAATREQAPTTAAPSSQAWTWLPIALSLLGVLGVMRLGLRERAAWRLLHRRKKIANRELRQEARTLLGESRLTKSLRLSSSARINVPMALGTREVVLPEKALSELTEAHIEALLAHELAHLVRRDPLWLGACRFAVALAWFQPLLRLLVKRLEQETELAADDWAAKRIGGGMNLAVCLERVGSWLAEVPTPATTAAMASRGSALVTRVERLLAEGAEEGRRTLFSVTTATTIALGIFACTGPSVTAENDSKHEGQMGARSKQASMNGSNNPEAGKVTTPLSEPGMSYHYIADDGYAFGSDNLEDLRKTLRENLPSGTFDEARIQALPNSYFDDFRPLKMTDFEPDPASGHTTEQGSDPDHAVSTDTSPSSKVGSESRPIEMITMTLTASGAREGLPGQPTRKENLREDLARISNYWRSKHGLRASDMQKGMLMIHVDARTPFKYVQEIMELCATREVQIANINVALTSKPTKRTDFSLPVGHQVVEELEEDLTGKQEGDLAKSGLQIQLRVRTMIDPGPGESPLSLTIRLPDGSTQPEESFDIPRNQGLEIDCDPDIPMGFLLGMLGRYVEQGTRITVVVSQFQGEQR
ncbi:MAG: M56 family metallopeptidase [bacterium]|nr:M56 family metallopeptidase [bacterium]